MAEKLFNNVINNAIDVDDVISWLTDEGNIFDEECSKIDFLTFFLNFIHEELPSNNKFTNEPVQETTPKRFINMEETQTPPENKNDIQKIFTTPRSTTKPSPDNYCSPVSPLYNGNASLYRPKIDKPSPLCIGDFITTKKGEDNPKQKRINPTRLCQRKLTTSFAKTENSFNFQKAKEVEIHPENVSEARNLLVTERAKILPHSVKTLNRPTVVHNTEIEANVKLVTFQTNIDSVVKLYVSVLRNSLVLNVTCELHFLISLLVKKQFNIPHNEGEEEPISNADLFNTIHNIVYFSIKCLECLIDYFKFYDNVTIRTLLQLERISKFSTSLPEQLRSLAENKPERRIDVSINNSEMICFNSETDNRNNFPTGESFQAFRKQRDLFYEVLRIWESNHRVEGWNFTSLNGKIKSLLILHNSSANYMHLARLFKANLINSCQKVQKPTVPDAEVPFANVDAAKLNKLTTRLVTKNSSNVKNLTPQFDESQTFYKDFILTANDPSFNKHLIDILISDILDLNNTKFNCDLDDEDAVDLVTKQSFIDCIKSLRVLAKFLGFVEFLPYRTDVINCLESVIEAQLKLREKVQPQFDIRSVLETSIKQENLVLTIPWLVKYLSMLDFVTLRLPYYKNITDILFSLSRNCTLTNYNSALLQFSLGWLFELPHFPDSGNFLKPMLEMNENGRNKGLDKLDVIDEEILYICCPFLDEIKRIVSNATLNSKNVTVKHITPTTAVQSPTEIAKRKIEIQLENAFFNGQPVSVRKTIEFVSERIASSCVKQICYTVVPVFAKDSLGKFRLMLEDKLRSYESLSEMEKSTYVSDLKFLSDKKANEYLKELKEVCDKSVEKIVNETIPPSIKSLLSVDVLEMTQNVCISICRKMCLERVNQWIGSHVNLSLFTKEFDMEIQRFLNETGGEKQKFVFNLPPNGSGKEHNEESLCAAHLLHKLKRLCIVVIEGNVCIKEDFLVCILNEAKTTLDQRSDVNECITACICILFVDFAILIITHQFMLMESGDVLNRFVQIWRCFPGKSDDLFKNILCSRNVMILAQSRNVAKSWNVLAHFVAFLIKEKLLTCEMFETQCTGLFKREWDPATLKYLTMFFKAFLEEYKKFSPTYDKFSYLLEFLGDFCVDL